MPGTVLEGKVNISVVLFLLLLDLIKVLPVAHEDVQALRHEVDLVFLEGQSHSRPHAEASAKQH